MKPVMLGAIVAATTGSAWGQYCEDVDLVHDGVLNIIDIVTLFEFWNDQNLEADFNADGVVDGLDLGYQIAHLYTTGFDCLALPVEGDDGFVSVVDVTDQVELDPGLRAYDVFVHSFVSENDIVLSVLNATLGCESEGCFVGPPFGSYLTIGAEPHFNPDLNYDMEAFMAGMSVGEDAGWWALPLGPPPGQVGDQFDVQVARFVMPEGQAIEGELSYLVYHPDDPEPLTVHTDDVFIPGDSCYADFNNDGALNILDYVAFQNAFTAGDPRADCNGCGCLDILQFLCFHDMFQQGCYE